MGVASARVQAKGQVTIPKEFREKLNVRPGDLVVFIETTDGLLVKPAVVMTDESLREEVAAIVRSIRERFAEYSTEDVDAIVAEALRETRSA